MVRRLDLPDVQLWAVTSQRSRPLSCSDKCRTKFPPMQNNYHKPFTPRQVLSKTASNRALDWSLAMVQGRKQSCRLDQVLRVYCTSPVVRSNSEF